MTTSLRSGLRSFLAVAVAAAAATLLTLSAACGSDSNPRPSTRDAGDDDIDASSADGAPAECLGEGGCFSCEPVQLPQFLNHCTDNQCFPFDNVVRLPRYNGGDLPPIE